MTDTIAHVLIAGGAASIALGLYLIIRRYVHFETTGGPA